MTNNIDLYLNSIPNFGNLTPSEQERCMRVNHLRVVAYCLEPLSLPDWEI